MSLEQFWQAHVARPSSSYVNRQLSVDALASLGLRLAKRWQHPA